ncbi:MAG: hypothetical protein ACOCUS_07115, partial [Polyangiales bacterium]
MRWVRILLALSCALCALPAARAAADGTRLIELRFTPTDRAQIALWIEKADGTFMSTVRLTEAVGTRGIGNRPGATQLNSGFRYPYGRREGALPVWAHRRYEAAGEKFPRVIFWHRQSTDGVHSGEGYASIWQDIPGTNTADDYFCLSFEDDRNALDGGDLRERVPEQQGPLRDRAGRGQRLRGRAAAERRRRQALEAVVSRVALS